MVKKINKNTDKCNCSKFDLSNLKLILFCFFFGAFGVHKFMQGKTKTGIAFIILDLTIFGFIITITWAMVDLILLTVKKGNPVGNVIVGLLLLCSNVFILTNIQYINHFVDTSFESGNGKPCPKKLEKCIKKLQKQTVLLSNGQIGLRNCNNNSNINSIILYGDKAVLNIDEEADILSQEEALSISPNWDYTNLKVYNLNDGIQDYEQDACKVLKNLRKFNKKRK